MKPYKIIEVIRETASVVTLRLVDDKGERPNFIAGQYVTVLFPDLDVPSGKAYSLSSTPSDPYMAITVKKAGIYSSRLHELKVGDKLLVSESYGFLNPNFDGPIIAIAGGIGIASLFSIIRDTLNRDPARPISLWYSNRTTKDIVFANEITDLTARYEQLQVKHFITRQDKVPSGFRKGRINIGKALAEETPSPDSFYFICGHEGFVGDIWRALVEAGISEDKIATEAFY